MTTPLLQSTLGSNVQVSIMAMTYNIGVSTAVDVRLLSSEGDVLQTKTCSLVDGIDDALEVTFPNAPPSSYRIQIAPQARIYLRGLEIMGASSERVVYVENLKNTYYDYVDVGCTKFAYSVKAVSEGGESD